jgi:hypothetical protein
MTLPFHPNSQIAKSSLRQLIRAKILSLAMFFLVAFPLLPGFNSLSFGLSHSHFFLSNVNIHSDPLNSSKIVAPNLTSNCQKATNKESTKQSYLKTIIENFIQEVTSIKDYTPRIFKPDAIVVSGYFRNFLSNWNSLYMNLGYLHNANCLQKAQIL